MYTNTDIVKLLLDFEKSLNYVNDRHNPVSMIVDRSCNKDWNDNIVYYVDNISVLIKENCLLYPEGITKSLRSIIKLYNKYYYRCDDRKLLIPSESEARLGLFGPTVFEAEGMMREFVYGSLKDVDSLIDFFSKNQEIVEELNYTFPEGALQDDITEIINLTYDEVLSDYKNCCYISAISLCGKIIETALYAIYLKVFGKNPDDEKNKMGIHALTNRLKKDGYEFDSLDDQISVIARHRNKAIHGNVIIPTKDETRGVIYFTKDVLIKIVSLNSKVC